METVITVKDVQEKSKDGSSWIELIDQNNRTHRIFRRVQDNEGNWHDLSGKYDMLRNSQNKTLKLIQEQKGKFTNVVDAEPVEEVFTQQAQKRIEDREAECRLRTFTTAYAKDLAVADKIPVEDMLGWAEVFYRYLQSDITVDEEKVQRLTGHLKSPEQVITRSTRKSPVRQG